MSSALDYPSDLTLHGSIPRTGRFNLLWSVSIALFLWAIEWANRDGSQRYGLWVNLSYALCIGYWCWTIIGMVWLSEARRRWMLLPDAQTRFELRGVYGLVSWPSVALCIVLGIPIACLFGTSMAQALLALPWPMTVPPKRPPFAVSLVLSYSVSLLTFTIDYLRVRLAANEKRAEAAQRQVLQAQLQLLQAQLQPHMLFNTLANLHALIESDPTRAQDMMTRLIAFLRATLSASRNTSHALAEEFARAADYLALMQIRMGPRLRVSLDLPDSLSSLLVPPMLLQPLVENAIKHGLEPSRQGGDLTVQARHDGRYLVLVVNDTGQGLAAAKASRKSSTGFGLSCVQDRLRSAYGLDATLHLAEGANGTGATATLRLPVALAPELSTLPPPVPFASSSVSPSASLPPSSSPSVQAVQAALP